MRSLPAAASPVQPPAAGVNRPLHENFPEPSDPADAPVRFPACVADFYPDPPGDASPGFADELADALGGGGGVPPALYEPPRPPADGPIPLAAFREEILLLYRPPLRAGATHGRMRYALGLASSLLGPGATTADFTPALVARIIAARPQGESRNTTLGVLSYFRAACTYAASRGYVRSSPFSFRKLSGWLRPSPSTRGHHHCMDHIRRVLDLLASEVESSSGWDRWRARRLQALAATVAYTGLRKDEALHLHAGDVDLGARMIALVERSRRMKTVESAQPIPVPEALAAILAPWMARRLDVPEAGSPRPPDCPYLFPNVTRSNCWSAGPRGNKPLDQLKSAGERAGVRDFTFMSLRHSYATHAESWGLSPAMIQRVLRHTSIKTQDHYRHPDYDNMRRAVGGIDFAPRPAADAGTDDRGGPTP